MSAGKFGKELAATFVFGFVAAAGEKFATWVQEKLREKRKRKPRRKAKP